MKLFLDPGKELLDVALADAGGVEESPALS